MSQLITLSKSAPEFESYLLGTFSKTHRAKSLESLNLNSETEQVTFELIPLNEIQKPSLGPLLIQWLRIRRLVIILFPFFYVAINTQGSVYDPYLMVLGVFSLIFIFWAIQLRNDFSDHMKGLDRITLSSGSRVIQNGWMTANTVRIWSWIFTGVSFLLACPIFISIPEIFFLAVLAGLLIFFSHFKSKSLFKTQIWGGWLQGLLSGPCLLIGLELLLKNKITLSGFCMGLVWGLFSLFVIFLHDFEMLIPGAQAGFRTWMVSLGFDQGRKFLYRWWIFCLLAYFGYHWIERSWLVWMPSLIILGYFSFKFLKKLHDLKTPAGSQMSIIRNEGYLLFILAVTLWTVEEVFMNFIQSVLSLWSPSV